jgi:hypothetical protein
MRVPRRARTYVRQNHLALLALFLFVTGGSAYALTGSNTVYSDDIVEGQVKTPDVAGVLSADVRDDTLTAGGLNAADLARGSVGSSEVAADSLGGSQVDQGKLETVPEAVLGGSGYSASVHGLCLPGGTYSACITKSISVPQATRLLVILAGRHREYAARCKVVAGVASSPVVYLPYHDGGNFMFTTVLEYVPEGNPVSVQFQCLSQNAEQPARISDIHMSILELAPP